MSNRGISLSSRIEASELNVLEIKSLLKITTLVPYFIVNLENTTPPQHDGNTIDTVFSVHSYLCSYQD